MLFTLKNHGKVRSYCSWTKFAESSCASTERSFVKFANPIPKRKRFGDGLSDAYGLQQLKRSAFGTFKKTNGKVHCVN